MSMPSTTATGTTTPTTTATTTTLRAGPLRPAVRRALTSVAVLTGAGMASYLAALLALWLGQERLLFHPQALSADRPLATQAAVRESFVDVPGARLSVLELRQPNPKGVVFFLHGNGGNLASWFVNTRLYDEANFDLVMLDYRGYGKSSGQIESEVQLHADVQAVWQRFAPRYRGKRVVVYGRSLGTGLAAALAQKIQPDLTLLVSPYRSMAALAAEHYPWVPAAVLRYPLRTDAVLPQIHTPVLLLHGLRDTLIPPAHSQALQALSPQVRVDLIPDAGHGDLQDFASYRGAVLNALLAL